MPVNLARPSPVRFPVRLSLRGPAHGEFHLTTARLLAVTLLIVATSAAQDRTLIKISTETSDAVTSGDGSGEISTTQVEPLPEAPSAHWVIDKKFVFIMGALGGAESLRFTSRKLVIEHEFAAGAPWVTHVPSNPHLVAKYSGLYAAELLVAYEMKKPHSWLPGDRVIRKFWWAYPVAMAALHIRNGVSNIRTQGPSGCTTVDCAMQIP